MAIRDAESYAENRMNYRSAKFTQENANRQSANVGLAVDFYSPSRSAELLRSGLPLPARLPLPPSLYLPDGTAAKRKPKAPPRFDGSSELRNAERQNWAASFQPPPRYTRADPSSGP